MPEISPMLPEDPASLGPYTLIGRLGRGGYGVVYLAESPGSGRVAIKLLQTQLAEAGGERDRFAREAAAAKQVARFCTAQVLDADIAGDQPYIVSEYVAGPSLQSLVTGQGPLEGGALDRLAIGTATALVAIHQAGVIHRDLKPPNVLIGPDGPRVIDFGIARMMDRAATVTGHTLGTPAYMAPEQVVGGEITPAADVFAWGATLAFAANGIPPFGRDSLAVLAHRILNEAPDLGVLSGRLRALVAECLDKDPARRPVAGALLMRLLGHEAVPGVDYPRTAILAEGVTAAVPTPGPPVHPPQQPTMPARGMMPVAGGMAAGGLAAAAMPAGGMPGGATPGGMTPVGTTPGTPRRAGARARKWGYALAGLAGAVVLAAGLIAGLNAYRDNGSGSTPPPTPTTVTTTETTRVRAAVPPATDTHSSSSSSYSHPPPPAQPSLSVHSSGCDLGTTDTTCTVTLTGSGAALDWTGSGTTSLNLSSSSGHLEPGESDTVTITLYAGTPRTSGSGTVTFTGGGRTHTVEVSWEGEAAPDPSTS